MPKSISQRLGLGTKKKEKKVCSMHDIKINKKKDLKMSFS